MPTTDSTLFKKQRKPRTFPPLETIIGQKFYWLTALTGDPITRKINCICDCGKEITIYASNLVGGWVRSCGCQKDRLKHGHASRHLKNGASHTYGCWKAMKGRVLHPTNVAYSYYGERGITICERWLTFKNFLADMGEAPSDKHTLERSGNAERTGP